MLLVLDDPVVRAHLAAAVRRHVLACRREGVPVPADLGVLAVHLAASGGLPRPAVVSEVDGGEDAGMVEPLVLRYADAAQRLSVSERSVRRLVHDGELPAVTVAGRRMVRSADLVEFVERLGHDAALASSEEGTS